MKGFLRRDWALLTLNLRFYLLFILVMCALSMYSQMSSGFVSIYIILLFAISIMNLFAYDEANHWEDYAFAAPDGRRAMVDARYALALCMGAAVMVIEFIIGRPGRESIALALMYGGIFFFYTALVLPIFYRFGSTKSRLVLIVVIVALGAATGAIGSMVTSQVVLTDRFPGMPWFVLPLGIALLWLISWPISRSIVRKKGSKT